MELVIANRDVRKAGVLAARYDLFVIISTMLVLNVLILMCDISSFHGRAISLQDLEEMSLREDDQDLAVVISTLPAHVNFQLPTKLLRSNPNSLPVVLDVVYKPAMTSLLKQASANNCLFVQGATMLLEQGIEQFQLWNQRCAPRFEMQQAIFANVEKIDST